MEQMVLDLSGESEEKKVPESEVPVGWVQVCDLPYCSEPRLFYDARMNAGIRVTELREEACRMLEKENSQLTMDDLKMAFLKMCPVEVELVGQPHKVTVKKYGGEWILACNCGAWVFNLSGNRLCKHTNYVGNLMKKGEW